MEATYDNIDRWYDRFGEECTLNGQAVLAIVSRVNTTEPPVQVGLRTAQDLAVRVRVSEVPSRPAARTVFSDSAGARYRVMGADSGSTRKEWLLTCTQEVRAA